MFSGHHSHHDFIRPRRERPFQRGAFKYILLQHIKDKPSYGYEIIQALRERFHSFYIPSPGIVYPTLQMLTEMGYVTANEQEGKRVYTITDEGLKFLNEQKEFTESIRSRTKRWWNPENTDDIIETRLQFEKLAQLLRDKTRTADAQKLERIRKAIAQAYEEIAKD
ncbi:MAG: PadR family transcriptional regulator [Chloroflexi bacterium]|nr:PadR family transcriptional regulator [Chloroflexota bacterium]